MLIVSRFRSWGREIVLGIVGRVEPQIVFRVLFVEESYLRASSRVIVTCPHKRRLAGVGLPRLNEMGDHGQQAQPDDDT